MRYCLLAVCIILSALTLTACSKEGESKAEASSSEAVQPLKPSELELQLKPMPGAVPSTEVLPTPPLESSSALED